VSVARAKPRRLSTRLLGAGTAAGPDPGAAAGGVVLTDTGVEFAAADVQVSKQLLAVAALDVPSSGWSSPACNAPPMAL
jgi:hypothetical protein